MSKAIDYTLTVGSAKIKHAINRGWVLKGQECKQCHRQFVTLPHMPGVFCCRECRSRWNFAKPERHPSWRGEDGNTVSIHRWVNRLRGGKPKECEWCGVVPGLDKLGNPKMHWANLSGKYKRDISDWASLCINCHYNYDKPWIKAWKTRRQKTKK